MPRRLLLAVVVMAALTAYPVASAALSSAVRGEIGGPPSIQNITRIPPEAGNKFTTPPIVIGKGKAFDGPVEIVAADSEAGFCVFVEYPRTRDGNGGSCGFAVLPFGGKAIEVQSGGGVIFPAGDRYTGIEGGLAPNVASVRVFFHRHGKEKRFRSRATIAQVSGELQNQLNQPEPFGYFAVKVRGCIAIGAFRAEALDASGNVIGSDRFGFGGWKDCLDPRSVLPPGDDPDDYRRSFSAGSSSGY